MKTTKYRLYTSVLLAFAGGTLFFSSCKKDEEIEEPEQTEEVKVRPITTQSSAYVTQLFDYTPGPGQFVNTAFGDADAAKTVLNGKQGLVSLGSYGGNIVLGFDHTVLNQSGKEDIVIYNNASATFAEPGVVWVMQDVNSNGKPDDIWYELSGSAQNSAGYTRNYSITYTRPSSPANEVSWTDNLGNSGSVKTNTFYKQAYYPVWITANTYTLTGTLLPSSNINNAGIITSTPFTFGYADNSAGSDKLDIANAIDEKGNKVALKGIDFIKIQTGIPYNLGLLGELSTEVKGIADISIEK
ncbi:cell surface protein [Mucilaginibacter sp. PAMB04274]|uniref:cell surface protein n=1 Tax=Mucilaginibacter sp. PAMB04274 TaxID=3138568 RepID=UPI0031F6DC22